MSIRLADPSDVEVVKSITKTTISAIYPRYYPKGAVDYFLCHHNEESISSDIALGRVYLCIDTQQNIVGTVTIKGNEICRLFVTPEHQGKGFGRELLDFAESYISDTYTESMLDASLPTKSLYIKRGYKDTEYNTIITDNDDRLCYDVMVKKLYNELDMKILSADITDPSVLALFSEHDDFMIDFLGDDKWCYTRYNENEALERVWVVFYKNAPIGCIAYRTKSECVGEVKRLFIRSRYRGHGISKKLLDIVAHYAKLQGSHTLFLDTRVTLEPAVSLYRSYGFSVVFQQGLYIQMEKKL